ncbi:MAG TPA: 16S rRNA (adenine(1518)-N(6)/adenine(1519)-N(6))-dimethyltransferase RsmA [Anaerolineaceae bacterium]|nr:16S rRNA (adenine(1518)-N(6)/adenine(1519)-N(6))-dimethyltransferase RsmA [Anaerolineaceae bacterium]HOR83368.1 16S rRNA (adenine(1518)-N(6)/adenine(1519)-N(6))-dimethyltransferase RsmA [Anaerolineaceae bacterium]HPL42928.1 16S rRNA (adenine(1518)-N(6)/adenine(1519)-N(6))-dimethyltransferase RsmA [Anaerolineaceae bacterium]
MTRRYLNAPALLREYGLQPKKSLGQNFLIDPSGLDKVMQAAGLSPEDTVLEIGAGLGSLTVLLAQTVRRVIAVEIDRGLIAPLTEAVSEYDNVQIVEGDILKIPPEELNLGEAYLVVANIPYYISSAIIRRLLETQNRPARIVLTVQQEVAERICAKDGKFSLLALSVQVFGVPRIQARIAAGCFYPAPDVDSAVLSITLYPQPLIATEELDTFFRLARAGFSQKRKTLRNTLSAGLGLPAVQAESLLTAAGIDPRRRAETLSIAEWGRLTDAWKRTQPSDFPGE